MEFPLERLFRRFTKESLKATLEDSTKIISTLEPYSELLPPKLVVLTARSHSLPNRPRTVRRLKITAFSGCPSLHAEQKFWPSWYTFIRFWLLLIHFNSLVYRSDLPTTLPNASRSESGLIQAYLARFIQQIIQTLRSPPLNGPRSKRYQSLRYHTPVLHCSGLFALAYQRRIIELTFRLNALLNSREYRPHYSQNHLSYQHTPYPLAIHLTAHNYSPEEPVFGLRKASIRRRSSLGWRSFLMMACRPEKR